jgi:hypothetical protein
VELINCRIGCGLAHAGPAVLNASDNYSRIGGPGTDDLMTDLTPSRRACHREAIGTGAGTTRVEAGSGTLSKF